MEEDKEKCLQEKGNNIRRLGPDGASQMSMASRHSVMLGGHPSAGAHYGGQYTSVYGSVALSSALQTAFIVSFLLIAHGYCITSEHLSVPERRATAVIGCVFYLILVSHRASLPYFSILLMLDYLLIFYVIFNHITQNLLVLREQLSFIEEEHVQEMHDAVYTKYLMFKKFKGAMHIVAIAEVAIFFNMNSSMENYWMKLLVREWAHFCIFLYIGMRMHSLQTMQYHTRNSLD